MDLKASNGIELMPNLPANLRRCGARALRNRRTSCPWLVGSRTIQDGKEHRKASLLSSKPSASVAATSLDMDNSSQQSLRTSDIMSQLGVKMNL
mmetsp:Transcript_53398/g.116919  ORF Transcript_53398/g.116919 Transcript_53398/m.116919 type:complete len:94 (+) Transcript_53398:904-1185(+)